MSIQKKFSYFPTKVDTWRNTKALIWLQVYYEEDSTSSPYVALSGETTVGEKWCNRLGFFSYEF